MSNFNFLLISYFIVIASILLSMILIKNEIKG